jgi:hypothetical protein
MRGRRLRARTDPPRCRPGCRCRRGGPHPPARRGPADPGPHSRRRRTARLGRHPRGWLFDLVPRLLDVENGRRPDPSQVAAALAAAGFWRLTTTTLWEVRRRYADREDYLAEIAARTGRSILHELDDEELADLVEDLRRRIPAGPLVEQDRWTLWRAVRAL